MARSFLSGIQIPTLPSLNIDGGFTLDSSAGTTGQILISQGGGTPAWTSSPNLLDPLLTSVSTVGGGGTEGGQINFARVTDGLRYWNVDSFGATSTPDLRFIEDTTERFRMVAGGTFLVGSTLNLTTTGISTVNTSGASGAITISSGTTSSGVGGVTSGSVTIGTGAGAGTGNNSGAIVVRTGAGSGSTGNSGSVTIDSGAFSGAGTAGAISIGTVNASAITIGRSGLTTTVGGNLTADQVFATSNGSGTNFKVGDDAWLGDINLSNTISIRGQQTAANGYLTFGNSDGTALGRAGSGPLTYGGEKVSYSSKVFSHAPATAGPSASSVTVSAFAAANDVLSGLTAATLYAFTAKYFITTSYTSGIYTMALLFTFNNAPASIKYSFKTYPQTVGTAMKAMGVGTSTTLDPLNGTQSASGSWLVEVDGYFTSHATLASTLTPQVQINPSAGGTSSASVQVGSWIEIEKLGTNSQSLIAGNWA